MISKTATPKRVEAWFNSAYLLTAIAFGVYYLVYSTSELVRVWGIMALVLAFGDAFHLLPRIAFAITGNAYRFTKAMGIGKLIASITMTFFYVILWQVGLRLQGLELPTLTAVVYMLAALRIVLCLPKQNGWINGDASAKWAIYRNTPFLLHGIMVIILFMQDTAYLQLAIAVALSFAFYIPVALYVHKNARLGMLMIPKTCAYVWIIAFGLLV